MLIYMFRYNEDIAHFSNKIKLVQLTDAYFKNIYFEYGGYEQLDLSENDDEMICVLTPKFNAKSDFKSLNYILKYKPDFENVTCVRNVEMGPITLQKSQFHHGENFIVLWNHLLEKLNLSYYKKIDFKNCYSNMFFIKNVHLKKFKTFMLKAIEEIEKFQDPFKKLLFENPNYKGNICPNVLMQKFGKPHYTFHAFLCERLIGLFCVVNKITINYSI